MTPVVGVQRLRLSVRAFDIDLEVVGRILAALQAPDGWPGHREVAKMRLAVHEVLMNIGEHAGLPPEGFVDIEIRTEPGSVIVMCRDEGEPFTGSIDGALPDVYSEEGYGLAIAQRASQRFEYTHQAGVNTWTLGFHPPA